MLFPVCIIIHCTKLVSFNTRRLDRLRTHLPYNFQLFYQTIFGGAQHGASQSLATSNNYFQRKKNVNKSQSMVGGGLCNPGTCFLKLVSGGVRRGVGGANCCRVAACDPLMDTCTGQGGGRGAVHQTDWHLQLQLINILRHMWALEVIPREYFSPPPVKERSNLLIENITVRPSCQTPCRDRKQ